MPKPASVAVSVYERQAPSSLLRGTPAAMELDTASEFNFHLEMARQAEEGPEQQQGGRGAKAAKKGQNLPDKGSNPPAGRVSGGGCMLKRKGVGKLAVKEGVKCDISVCDRFQAVGSSYCWPHKRGWGRIVKHGLKGKKQRDENYLNYIAIFGEGRDPPPDPDLAEQVIVDVCAGIPDDEDDEDDASRPAKVRKCAPVNLSKYVHRQGSRMSSDAVTSTYKWDFEIFQNKLKAIRGWSSAQCQAEFAKLKANPMTKADESGRHHALFGCTRVKVPPELIGEEKEELRRGQFEERTFETATKAKTMSDEEKSLWKEATNKGFQLEKSPSDDDLAAMMTPLRPDDVASELDMGSFLSDILKQHVDSGAPAGDEPGASGGAGPSGSSNAAGAGLAGLGGANNMGGKPAAPAPSPGKKDAMDWGASRSRLWARVRDSIKQHCERCTAEMKSAKGLLHKADSTKHGDIFIKSVLEKYDMCMHFIGQDVKVSAAADGLLAYGMQSVTYGIPKPAGAAADANGVAGVEGAGGVEGAAEAKVEPEQGEPEKGEAEKGEGKEESAAGAGAAATAATAPGKDEDAEPLDQASMLAAAIEKCDVMPMESADLWSIPRMEAFRDSVGKVQSETDLETSTAQWESQMQLATQLVASLKSATKELASEMKREENKVMKERSQNAQKEREQEEAQKKEAEAQARRQMAHQKQSLVFMLDYTSDSGVRLFADDDELRSAKNKSQIDWSEPVALRTSKTLADILSHEGKLKPTIGRWSKAFPNSKVFKENDIVSAPIVECQGNGELGPLLGLFFASDELVTSPLPSFHALTSGFKLFGESSTLASFDFEPMFLGSLRAQIEGVSKFVLVDSAKWVEALVKDGAAKNTLQLSEMREKMKMLSDGDLKKLTESGCCIRHLELSVGQCLYVPAGWFVAQTSFGESSVTAAKRALIPKFEKALAQTTKNIDTLLELGMKTNVRQSLGTLKVILAVTKPKV